MDYDVQVSPDDDLQEAVRRVTGLPPERQRLIYRGRLVGPTVQAKDVEGLQDGQTIHLVPKPERSGVVSSSSSSSTAVIDGSPTTTSSSSHAEDNTSPSNLLGALLDSAASRPRRSRRRYRLTQEDLELPDPGSAEPVRQGLLTLHTLLHPSRQFYRGQWIDCRDTVNQWLEATIVDIVEPDEILPQASTPPPTAAPSRPTPTTDAVVFAADLEGRRRLLLESCDAGDPDELEPGLRPRPHNVPLLLLHYNGWPHRWDEWIRSDSERIRPFRTRTRHSGLQVLPLPDSYLVDAPETYIRSDNEAQDRAALLLELHRAVGRVEQLLGHATQGTTTTTRPHLPWGAPDRAASEHHDDDDDDLESLPALAYDNRNDNPEQRRRALEQVAPLLDRLGRTLVAAAPHVAALATAEPEEVFVEEQPRTLGGLLSLLSRDRRRQSMASTNVVVGDNATTSGQTATTTESVDPDYADFASAMVNTVRGDSRRRREGGDELAGMLGAYLAAASLGDEGEGGGGGGLGQLLRQRGDQTGGIDIHIHAIVTSTGGGPGWGGLTVLGGGGGGTGDVVSPARETFSRRRTSGTTPSPTRPSPIQSSPSDVDDDLGIFSALYSENPDPIDPQSPSSRGPSPTIDNESSSPVPLSLPNRSDSSSLQRDSSRPASGTSRGGSRRGNVFGRMFRRSNP